MVLLIIIGISIVQFGLYYLIKKYRIRFPKLIILLTLLLCYFFVFPEFFYPKQEVNEIDCGMPTLGIILAFWFFGTIAGIATHVIWVMKFKNT
ncbi:hypothetical protein [uncultured Tenacibaculum sp.]|uniref:hypothetical protein n=1 Tax=uncultured Tenacibaculum sp. TaxID=174713 RepID=UPI00261D1947|nr:hypothetical protein [uncultured Tenacibaculum sp.]